MKCDVLSDKWRHTVTQMSIDDDGVTNVVVKAGHAVGHLQSPCGLAVHQETGNLIVADTGNDRVQVRLTPDSCYRLKVFLHDSMGVGLNPDGFFIVKFLLDCTCTIILL